MDIVQKAWVDVEKEVGCAINRYCEINGRYPVVLWLNRENNKISVEHKLYSQSDTCFGLHNYFTIRTCIQDKDTSLLFLALCLV
jgi:hypothetical protein